MARYGILVYSSASAGPVAIPPGRCSAAFVFRPGTPATAIRGDVVSTAPFQDGPLVVAGFLVVEAPDLDVALAVTRASSTVRDGGAEVRPLA